MDWIPGSANNSSTVEYLILYYNFNFPSFDFFLRFCLCFCLDYQRHRKSSRVRVSDGKNCTAHTKNLGSNYPYVYEPSSRPTTNSLIETSRHRLIRDLLYLLTTLKALLLLNCSSQTFIPLLFTHPPLSLDESQEQWSEIAATNVNRLFSWPMHCRSSRSHQQYKLPRPTENLEEIGQHRREVLQWVPISTVVGTYPL